MNWTRHLLSLLILAAGLAFLGNLPAVRAETGECVEEARRPLSDFHVYRGNSHSHTIFTWTHGAHRSAAIRDLESPTEFHPAWDVPPGVDWRDHRTIRLDPQAYTNRQGLPANHLELARAHGYDFYAITDHTQEPTLQPVSRDNRAWQATLKAVEAYDDDPGFVALAGFEYSRNTAADGGSGHINVLNACQYVNADHGQRGPAPPWPEANWSLPQFYDWLKSSPPVHNGRGEIVVGFNHPQPDQYQDWDHIDDGIVEWISTFEVHTNYNRIRWDAYVRALNKGWKVSPIGVHDNHGYGDITDPRRPPPTLVLAPELTKEAITRAMRQRRTFASWNEGVELRYSVNGWIMGSTLDGPERFEFQIAVNTRPSHPAERVRRIQILSDGTEAEGGVQVAAEALFDGDQDSVVWNPVIEDPRARYFLLRVHHGNDIRDDGTFEPHGSTLSAPVWTGR
jgi:hypothetical protein